VHHPTAPQESEHAHHIERRARYGLVLFSIYLVLYGAFVYMNAFSPGVMARLVGGVNVAVLYGFALIAAALVLALIYDYLCRRMHS
jgi:uncharacterized membrane protein (DUF485 family)